MSAGAAAGTGINPAGITGLLLAGGAARRMDGADKGLLRLHGRPLAAWVLDALRPQVGLLLLSANRNLAHYRQLGVPVIADNRAGFQGPLAGIASALTRGIASPWLLVVPCDTPLLPADLGRRLVAALAAVDASGAIAVARAGGRVHPLHALLAADLSADLEAYLASGGRSVRGWLAGHRVCEVPFDDCPDAFLNCNDPADLARLRARFAAPH
ncbi:MAG: molybdenum cofactor guanylyltransferase [Chromatiaceae bacterium]|nr:MAG: molybdenum cofactor guanylyltransferase [Chromatiaceae bacterium]